MTYDPGRPWQPPPTSSTVSTQLVARVYAMVLEDTSMLGTVATGAVVSALVFAGIAVPAWLLGGVDLLTDSFNPVTLLLYAVAGWASAFVTILFSGAVVAAGSRAWTDTRSPRGRHWAWRGAGAVSCAPGRW